MSDRNGPRVLQVVLRLTPGGTERLVIELVKRSLATIPTAVCCLDESGAWGDDLRREGVVVDVLNRQPGFHPGLARQVAAAAKRHRANVIHAHQYSPFVYSALSRPWWPTRVVFTEHGRLSDAPPSLKRRIANQILARFPYETFAVSDELRQHIVDEGFPARAVGVIYNGIDIGPAPTPADRGRVRAELGVPPDVFVVGTIARLDPVKDLGTLIRAVAVANRTTPTVLLVVGDGSERQALEALARDVDGAISVRFLGHRDDARSILAGCDAYANSSISEGVSLTILEAMAAALPIVATRVGGTPEVVDESCARTVPARDAQALAAALGAVAASADRGHALGAAGRRRVEERFTLERMVRDYQKAYRRAFEGLSGNER